MLVIKLPMIHFIHSSMLDTGVNDTDCHTYKVIGAGTDLSTCIESERLLDGYMYNDRYVIGPIWDTDVVYSYMTDAIRLTEQWSDICIKCQRSEE